LIVTISFRAKNEQLANHLSVFSSGDFRSLLKDQTAIPDDLKICAICGLLLQTICRDACAKRLGPVAAMMAL
jgi:hypothetical protein